MVHDQATKGDMFSASGLSAVAISCLIIGVMHLVMFSC